MNFYMLKGKKVEYTPESRISKTVKVYYDIPAHDDDKARRIVRKQYHYVLEPVLLHCEVVPLI